jgi:hypothetical protein
MAYRSLIIEDEDQNVSLYNTCTLMRSEGAIVGIMHGFVRYEEFIGKGKTKPTLKEITRIFYQKGYVHTSLGFSIFDKTNPDQSSEEMPKIIALSFAVSMIPGINPLLNQSVYEQFNYDYDKIFNDVVNNHKQHYFVFQIPNFFQIADLHNSPGMIALKNQLDLMEDNQIYKILEGCVNNESE